MSIQQEIVWLRSPDADSEYCISKEYAIAPCGYEQFRNPDFPNIGIENFNRHLAECGACKVVQGKTKRKVLECQRSVARLFEKGLDGYRTSTNHYSSEGGELTHYRTLEAIRTFDGLVIRNTQCWARGFAKRSIGWDHIGLPLTAIGSFYRNQLRAIKIVESKDSEVLFTILDDKLGLRTMLYSEDSTMRFPNEFLVELPINALTIARANESLIPQGLDKSAKRQGDLFFVETDYKAMPTKEPTKTMREFGNTIRTTAKKGYRVTFPQIQDTRHTVTRIGLKVKRSKTIENGQTVIVEELTDLELVSGIVRHVQHFPLKLGDKWHLVFKNRALRSFDLRNRQVSGVD